MVFSHIPAKKHPLQVMFLLRYGENPTYKATG